MDGVRFDKEYWPKCGTMVDARPYDLNDLWDDYDDQASVFIAEALISKPPFIHLDVGEGCDVANVAVSFWEVGGDTIVAYAPLSELIEKSCRVYDKIRSLGQADDAKCMLAQLEEVSSSLARARDYLEQQLNDFAQKSQGSPDR
jgi:hypothetical protein